MVRRQISVTKSSIDVLWVHIDMNTLKIAGSSPVWVVFLVLFLFVGSALGLLFATLLDEVLLFWCWHTYTCWFKG